MDPETGGRCIRSLRMVRVAAGNGLKLHFFLGAVFLDDEFVEPRR